MKTDTSERQSVESFEISKEIEISAPIEVAFEVFTEQFDLVKPRDHSLLGVEIAESVFERRVGGCLYDRGVDGSDCRWARVLAYEPPQRFVIGVRRSRPNAFGRSFTPGGAWRRLYSARSIIEIARSTTSGSKPSSASSSRERSSST